MNDHITSAAHSQAPSQNGNAPPLWFVYSKEDRECLKALGLDAQTRETLAPDGREIIILYAAGNRYAAGNAAVDIDRCKSIGARAVKVLVLEECQNTLIAEYLESRSVTIDDLVAMAAQNPGWSVDEEAVLPRILIRTTEHEVTDEAVAALTRETNLFQRSGELVSIIADCKPKPERSEIRRAPGSLRIRALPHGQIRRLLTLHARWQKSVTNRGKIEIHDAHPPDWAVDGVATLGLWQGIRPLEGIIEAPTLRVDGSLIDQPGYDPDTGLWFAPEKLFPPIPENPTRGQACLARDELMKIVVDFPFAGDEHKAAWLASCLTALARFAVDGPCPLFLFDANSPGAGKNKLCDIVAILATGREMTCGNYSSDQVEMAKMLISAVMAGDRFVLFDNIAGGNSVGGSALDRFLTARTVKDRILGRSEMSPELPVNIVFYATGNNLGVKGDALRRIVHCRLETDQEHPEDRLKFTVPGNLLNYVKEQRSELVVAGLTILRAYISAGCPDQEVASQDYPEWCALIRSAVKWVTGHDPCATRKGMQAVDDETSELKAIIEGWEMICNLSGGIAQTVSQALERLDNQAPMIATLRETFLSWSRDGRMPSAVSIGKRITKHRDRPYDGKRFKRTSTDPIAWFVEKM